MSLKIDVSDYNERFYGESLLEEDELSLYDLSYSTTILDLNDRFGCLARLRTEFEESKMYAQNELSVTKAAIEDIEREYLIELTEVFYDELQNKHITIPLRFYLGWQYDYLGFKCMEEGFIANMFDLRNSFHTEDDLDNERLNAEEFTSKLEDIALGAAKALFLTELRSKRDLLTGGVVDEVKEKVVNKKPLNTNREKSVPSNLTYFELKPKYSKMKEFKSELESLGYIAKGFPVENFRRVFLFQDDLLEGKIRQRPVVPIEWLGSKSHLGYLIKQLAKHNLIISKEYYKIAENCFFYKGLPISNTVFHGMQLPSEDAKRKIDRIVALLM